MARGKAKKKEEHEEVEITNPETTQRKRLKSLALSNNMLSEIPARSSVHLNPSSVVAKHHGKDIIKKSQRKSSRYLFSFPGLVAPVSAGKIGELKDLGTKNPVLYLDFPQGQMKLFGTIVYPKNRYLTLQFPRGGKSVMCEDYFDNMIVFADAWWIGKKDENPEEAKLEFPKELYEGPQAEYDFKGGAGAGAASVVNQGVPRTKIQRAEQESPKTPTEDDLSDSEINLEDTKELVPVRHSARTATKSYKFAEISSGDDSGENSPDLSEHEETVAEVDTAVNDHNSSKTQKKTVVFDLDNEDDAPVDKLAKENNESASRSKSKKGSLSASASASTEVKSSNRGSLVQATISTLFKKVEEKKTPRNSRKSPSSKVSGQKLQTAGSKRKINLDEGSKKRARKNKDKDPGEKTKAKSKEYDVEDDDDDDGDDDDIEEFSNASEDTNGSDEDWAA